MTKKTTKKKKKKKGFRQILKVYMRIVCAIWASGMEYTLRESGNVSQWVFLFSFCITSSLPGNTSGNTTIYSSAVPRLLSHKAELFFSPFHRPIASAAAAAYFFHRIETNTRADGRSLCNDKSSLGGANAEKRIKLVRRAIMKCL